MTADNDDIDDDRDTHCADRVKLRPNPEDWGARDLITLREAVRIFWPNGPFTIRSLRTAVGQNALGTIKRNRRLFTTREAIEAWTRVPVVHAPAPLAHPPPPPPPPAQPAPLAAPAAPAAKPALSEAAQRTLQKLAEVTARPRRRA